MTVVALPQRFAPTILRGMRRLPIAVLVFAMPAQPPVVAAETSPARALIERSIAYHDPDEVWWTSARTIELRQPRAAGAERRTTFALFPDASQFQLIVEESDRGTALEMHGDSCRSLEVERDFQSHVLGIDCTKGRLYRDYYAYLFNLPMNLLDDAAKVEPQPFETTFLGRPVRAVRITYGEGEPRWEHYFDPATAALVGCRFTRDPESKTGEYIVYGGKIEAGGVRLPRERAWHYNDGGSWLGTDVIESLRIEPPSAPVQE
jgi:hypothetical protein